MSDTTHGPALMAGAPQAPHDPEPRFEGPSVLWAGPGRVVLLFGLLAGLSWWVHDRFLAEPEEPETPVALPSRVEQVLAQEHLAQPQAPEPPKQGLVNLLKDMAEPIAPKPSEPQAGQGANPSAGQGAAAQGPQAGHGDAPQAGQGDAPQAGQGQGAAKNTAQDELPPIEDPKHALAHFYAKLKHTEAKEPGAVTRIAHFGDSVIVADFVTGGARRKFQARFGDAGHGWVLIDKPWDFYLHEGVHFSSDLWRQRRITSDTISDNRYGLGGVTALASGGGAWATYKTVEEGPVGQRLSRFQLFYSAQPKGGQVAVEVDGQEKLLLSTASDTVEDKVETLSLPDGPHKVKVISRGGGEVRLFGVVLEREVPGVTYDSLGITGIRAKILNRFDEKHLQRQLQQRDLDLVIVMLGTNESEFTGMPMAEYEQDYRTLLRRIRQGLPDRSCLALSPPDRDHKDDRGRLVTIPLLKKIIEVQRKVALEEGCAFWSTYEAMGGENSMAAWYRHKPSLGSGDFTHFTKAGGDVLGAMLFDALMAARPKP